MIVLTSKQRGEARDSFRELRLRASGDDLLLYRHPEGWILREKSGTSLGVTGWASPRIDASVHNSPVWALGDGRAFRLPIPSATWLPSAPRPDGPWLCVPVFRAGLPFRG